MGISHGGPYDGPDKERLLLRDRLGDIVKFHMHKESNRRLDFVRVLLDTAMYMTEQQMVTDTINHPDIHYKPLTLQELGHALINEDLAAPDFIVGSLSKLWGDAAHKYKEDNLGEEYYDEFAKRKKLHEEKEDKS